jgi:hypothetical protein
MTDLAARYLRPRLTSIAPTNCVPPADQRPTLAVEMGSTQRYLDVEASTMVTNSLERLRAQIEALQEERRRALDAEPVRVAKLEAQISALTLASAIVETLGQSGPLDYALLRQKLYERSPEEAAIAAELGLFPVE